MIICLHKGTGLVGSLIKWQTRGKYSHASLMLSCHELFESREFKGVRIADIYEKERIDFFHVRANVYQQSLVLSFLEGLTKAKYDYRQVFRFITRMREADGTQGKYFCSELVFDALHKAGIDLFINTEGWEVSPHLISRSPILKRVQYEEILQDSNLCLDRLFDTRLQNLRVSFGKVAKPRVSEVQLQPNRKRNRNNHICHRSKKGR